MEGLDTATALWWAVVASGIYHGVNPGMGWPLAVSAALMDKKRNSLFGALIALAAGHLVAMGTILFPFAALLFLAEWQREIQIFAACLVLGLGVYLFFNRRHPRILARARRERAIFGTSTAKRVVMRQIAYSCDDLQSEFHNGVTHLAFNLLDTCPG